MNAAIPTFIPFGLVGVADGCLGAPSRRAVGQNIDERRLVRYQRLDVIGIGRHERERRHGATAAGEHLDRAGAERLDHGVDVGRLNQRRLIDAAVLADAAPKPARVIGDDRPVKVDVTYIPH